MQWTCSCIVKKYTGTELRLRLHGQIKHALCEQIRTILLYTDPKFEQLQATLFAHVNPSIGNIKIDSEKKSPDTHFLPLGFKWFIYSTSLTSPINHMERGEI